VGCEVSIEGRLTELLRATRENAEESSRVQVLRNVENAVTKIGRVSG
jgi:hypothetical protein